MLERGIKQRMKREIERIMNTKIEEKKLKRKGRVE